MTDISVPDSGDRNLFYTFVFSIILIVLAIFNLFWGYGVGWGFILGIVAGIFGILACLLRNKILMLVYLILCLILLVLALIVIIVILVYLDTGRWQWFVALLFAIITFAFLFACCWFGWKAYKELS